MRAERLQLHGRTSECGGHDARRSASFFQSRASCFGPWLFSVQRASLLGGVRRHFLGATRLFCSSPLKFAAARFWRGDREWRDGFPFLALAPVSDGTRAVAPLAGLPGVRQVGGAGAAPAMYRLGGKGQQRARHAVPLSRFSRALRVVTRDRGRVSTTKERASTRYSAPA
jgi:hypothetical protein